ncbi:MAG: hypothetical protein AAFY26_22470 [Cyanobacteria bacterium J06638_22]
MLADSWRFKSAGGAALGVGGLPTIRCRLSHFVKELGTLEKETRETLGTALNYLHARFS